MENFSRAGDDQAGLISSESKRQISDNISYMWNLKKKKNDTKELIYKIETDK